MNSPDKQHAWDTLVTWLREKAGVLFDDSYGEQTAVERLVRHLWIEHEGLERIREVVAVPPEPPLFTDDELAVLRIIVSTAVWIRSEQLANPNAMLRVRSISDQIQDDALSAEVDTHNLILSYLTHEFQAGQKLFTKLTQYCSDHGIKDPEWRK